MKEKKVTKHRYSDYWGFWIAAVIASVFFFAFNLGKNDDGYITTRKCVEWDGPTRVDPRTGDGPECNEYEPLVVKESAFDSGMRGLRDNAIYILFAGIGGLFLMSELQDKYIHHQE